MGYDVILVARTETKLQKQKTKLESQYHITAHVIPINLSILDAGEELYSQIKNLGLEVDVVIYNGGFAVFGSFVDAPWDNLLKMFNVDMVTLANLTWRFANDMKRRGGGHILNVASYRGHQR